MMRRAACGVVAGAALTLAAAGAATALTVDRENVIEGGHRFEVRCDEPETHTWTVPAGAQRVEVLEPVAGQAVADGFGDLRVATIRDVVTRTEPDGRLAVDVTAVGSDAACGGAGGGGAWLTTGVTFRARYHVVSDEPVLVSDDQAGMHARQRPARLTANADAGWRGLHWRSWGGASAAPLLLPGGGHAVADPDLRRQQALLHADRDALPVGGAEGGAPPGEAARHGLVPQSPSGCVTAKPSAGRCSIVQREPVRERALVSKRMPATTM